jgi:threonine aldolase
VWAVTLGPETVRLVTHCDVGDAAIARAVDAIHRAP